MPAIIIFFFVRLCWLSFWCPDFFFARFHGWSQIALFVADGKAAKREAKIHYLFSRYFVLRWLGLRVWHAKCLIFQHSLCKFIITSNLFIFICAVSVRVSLNWDMSRVNPCPRRISRKVCVCVLPSSCLSARCAEAPVTCRNKLFRNWTSLILPHAASC